MIFNMFSIQSIYVVLIALLYTINVSHESRKESQFNLFSKEYNLMNNKDSPFISLLTYNIRDSNLDKGINSWESRKSLILEELNTKLPADIIGFQEGLADQLDYLKHNLINYQITCLIRKVNVTQENMVVFFNKNKFELLEENYFWLSENPSSEYSISWGADLPRIIGYVHLKLKQTPNYEFVVANTHFDNLSAKARQKSAELVVKYFDSKFSSKKVPIFIMGDFNEANNEVVFNVFQENNYQDAILDCENTFNCDKSCKAFYSPNSYHDFFGSIVNHPDFLFFQYYEFYIEYNYFPNWYRHHIDWILFKNFNDNVKLNVKLVEMYEGEEKDFTNLLSLYKENKTWKTVMKNRQTYPSDHFPIIAVIELQPSNI
jgi:endonuclease/exonuclease/phosphatase family metal-dependent hydrolase